MDLSNNKIETVTPAESFPEGLMFLKLRGNPIAANGFGYRKQFVEALPELQELDKIKVLAAERLSYQGLLPKVKIDKLLTDLMEERAKSDATRRLEFELKLEMQEKEHKSAKEQLASSLDEFAQLDEFDALDQAVSGMLNRQALTSANIQEIAEVRQKKITETVADTSQRYGRIPTPSQLKAARGRKAANLKPVSREPVSEGPGLEQLD